MARAAGVSLIAPLALLGGAALVAVGGGGFGGLGSLAQIASGPSVPSTDLVSAGPRSRSLGPPQVVALRLDGPRTGRPGSASSAASPGGGVAPPPSGSGPGAPVAPPRREVALNPVAPPAGSAPTTQPSVPQPQRRAPAPAPPPPPAAPPAAPAPVNPVSEVINTTRDIGESLPTPLGPTVGNTVDSLVGPRQ